ncbi:MAG TPA: hypothetical protein VNH64_03450 [Parvularculaceae bacterium]|nr:hypothetical protein [Parvularculaceae bacterium]
MMSGIPSRVFAAALLVALASCATLSPRSRVEAELVSLGLTKARAGCLAGELDRRLDRRDMRAVGDFLGSLRGNDGDNVLDALRKMDNPRAVSAMAGAGIACAIDG